MKAIIWTGPAGYCGLGYLQPGDIVYVGYAGPGMNDLQQAADRYVSDGLAQAWVDQGVATWKEEKQNKGTKKPQKEE